MAERTSSDFMWGSSKFWWINKDSRKRKFYSYEKFTFRRGHERAKIWTRMAPRRFSAPSKLEGKLISFNFEGKQTKKPFWRSSQTGVFEKMKVYLRFMRWELCRCQNWIHASSTSKRNRNFASVAFRDRVSDRFQREFKLASSKAHNYELIIQQ